MALFGLKDDGSRAKPAPFAQPRGITASATRISLQTRADREKAATDANSVTRSWQRDAWMFYDSIGEIKYGFGLVASVLSRIRIYAGVVHDPDAPPVAASQLVRDKELPGDDKGEDIPVSLQSAEEADRLVKDLDASAGAVSTLMRVSGLNLCVAGECYLAEIDGVWSARSTEEIRITSTGNVELRPSQDAAGGGSGNGKIKKLGKDTPIGRVWRQHPRYSMDPDSSMKALTADCEELLLMSRMVRSTIRARLNAGILFVPDTMEVAAQSPSDDPNDASDPAADDTFSKEMYDSMVQPITDEASGSSVVPLLVRGPADQGDKIKHIEIRRSNDDGLINRAQVVLERVLQGLDVPKDIVTGLANVKYANAVVIDENLYKAHIEPLALMICDALTEIYLRPMLKENGVSEEDAAKIVVWYDPSEVVVRPDRGVDADNGYDRFLISADAWRRAHSFSDADAPTEDELARRLALEKVQIPEDATQTLLMQVLATIFAAAAEAAGAAQPIPEALQEELDGTASAPVPEPEIPDPAATQPPEELMVPDDASELVPSGA